MKPSKRLVLSWPLAALLASACGDRSDPEARDSSGVPIPGDTGATEAAASDDPARRSTRPRIVARPTVTGDATVGATLTASAGTWSGTGPITTTFQWQRCEADGGGCRNLRGVTRAPTR